MWSTYIGLDTILNWTEQFHSGILIAWVVDPAGEADGAVIPEPDEEKQSVTVHQSGVSCRHLLPEEKHSPSKAYLSG